jgi:hypothetical protein
MRSDVRNWIVKTVSANVSANVRNWIVKTVSVNVRKDDC